MKFLCGSCRTKYQISDEKVRGKILTIRCKKCGAKVVVKESLARQASLVIAPIAEEEAQARAEAPKVALGSACSRRVEPSRWHRPSTWRWARPSTTCRRRSRRRRPMKRTRASSGTWRSTARSKGLSPTPSWFSASDQGRHRAATTCGTTASTTGAACARSRTWRSTSPPDPSKKPPPPPPAPPSADPGGKVVDFAQKRAERDRKGRESLSPEEVEALSSEPPTAQGRAASRADRAEQLDSVLNEALGIGGEGQTARAKSEASKAEQKALGAALSQGASLSNDFASEPSDSFLPEDIFDNVPRASAQEMVARENTRFFVQAAGVNSQKSKNRAGVIGGAAIAAIVFSFVGAWAAGWIQISIPGIGNPFQNTRAEEPVEDEGTADLSAEEKKLLEGLSGAEKKAQIKKVRSRRKPVASAGAKIEYADNDLPGSGAAGSRGHDEGAGTVGIDIEKGGGAGPSGAVGDHSLPTSDPTMPVVETGKLDEKALRQVINENKTAVATCYQRELKGNQDLKGRLDFLVTVSPTGSVSRVSINSPQFRQTALAQCIADKIKVWRFPAFQGAEVQVIVPFVLARSS